MRIVKCEAVWEPAAPVDTVGGVTPLLTLANGSSVCLKADLGYQHVINSSIITGWKDF